MIEVVPSRQHTAYLGIERLGSDSRILSTLQLGLHWFPEGGGGLDRVYYDLMRALPTEGVRCRGLVAGSARAESESDGQVRAFAATDVALPKRWKAVRAAVREELASGQFDLVVSHFALYVFPVLGMIARRGRPLVVHFQGPWGDEGRQEGAGRVAGWTKTMVERRVYRRAKRLIVLCEPYRRMLASDFGVAEDRIRRVPPGIDTARFRTELSRAEAREKLGWPKDRPIVFVVRRLVSRMGLEDLIDAAVEVRNWLPEVLILIAGKGRLVESLQERINSLGLHEHVKLVGFVADSDLPIAYTAADLTVVPTVALEGFGVVVIESLAAGTPVLVTPVGGLPDGVIGLAPQLVLPSTGPTALAEGIIGVLKGRIPVPTREECQVHAETNFDWRVIAKKVRGVYEEALGSS